VVLEHALPFQVLLAFHSLNGETIQLFIRKLTNYFTSYKNRKTAYLSIKRSEVIKNAMSKRHVLAAAAKFCSKKNSQALQAKT